MSDIKFPVVPKEVIDKLLDDGWTMLYEGPTIPTIWIIHQMTKTQVLDNPLEQVSVDVTIPEDDGLVGADSIRAGIDAEILEKMEREALAAEDAAIVDDLKRQMEAGCVMPQVYVPLQVSHIFKKEEGDK